MRKKPPGGLVSASAHQIEREYKILKTLNDNAPDFPVPKVYLIEEREDVIGGGFFVSIYLLVWCFGRTGHTVSHSLLVNKQIMNFVEGRIFADPRLWSVQSQKDKEELWLSASRTLARLHRYTPAQLGLSNLSAPGSGFYARQLKSFTRLSEQQAKAIKDGGGVKGVAGTGDLPRFGEMVQWLDSHMADVPKTEGVLMHGDFKFDNLIFAKDRNEVIAVLDWCVGSRSEAKRERRTGLG